MSVLAGDSVALVALYNATNGPEWPLENKWLKEPIRKWLGVKTERVDGERRVTSVILSNMKLKGQLPRELKSLTALKKLDLSYNKDLKGDLIEEVFELKELTTLNLRFTGLTGTLSPAVGQLTSLDTLDLWTSPWDLNGTEYNPNPDVMTGELPAELGDLKQIRFLRLGRQGFTGELPEQMGGMTNLSYLDVARCRLSGGIPASFGNLKNLQTFFADKNRFDQPLPEELCQAESLLELYLNDNEIPGQIPEAIGDLRNLNALDLDNNRLTGVIPASIDKLEKLGLLYLNDNQLEGPIPAGICTMHPGLIKADLSNNNLTGNVPEITPNSFMGGAWYTSLVVYGNKLTGSIPESYLQFEESRDWFLPQQEGYGFSNLK